MKKLLMIMAAAVVLLTGCKTVEYVAVPQQHTEHHWHTDSVHTTDSVICEKTTTIMQLDSAAMAAYGIQLKAAERAWLVKTQEMERIIQEMMAKSVTRDTVRDTVTIVQPAPQQQEKQLTKWQRFRIKLANWLLWAVGALVVAIVCRFVWRIKH